MFISFIVPHMVYDTTSRYKKNWMKKFSPTHPFWESKRLLKRRNL